MSIIEVQTPIGEFNARIIGREGDKYIVQFYDYDWKDYDGPYEIIDADKITTFYADESDSDYEPDEDEEDTDDDESLVDEDEDEEEEEEEN
jgi:hypothetical protein